MLFAYDFPHKKTQDFILRLIAEDYVIDYIIAAPWQKLNIPKGSIRINPRHEGLIAPSLLAKRLKIPYIILPHNSREAIEYLEKHPVHFYIISGARILKSEVIDAARNRIINIHPGLIPQTRGLDTLLWCIYKNQPAGNTAHFIDSGVDSGIIIYKEKLKIYPDDNIIDIALRQIEVQTDILIKALALLRNNKANLIKSNASKSKYNKKMAPNLEKEAIKGFYQWLNKFSSEIEIDKTKA